MTDGIYDYAVERADGSIVLVPFTEPAIQFPATVHSEGDKIVAEGDLDFQAYREASHENYLGYSARLLSGQLFTDFCRRFVWEKL